MNIKEFVNKNKETLQIAYGVFLIILIPLLIAYNTIFIIGIYNRSMDSALQRQALVVGRSIYALIKDDLSNPEAMQSKIERLSGGNQDIQKILVLAPSGEDFKVIADSGKEDIGKLTSSPYYGFAWKQPDNDGIVTDSLKLSAMIQGEELVGSFADQGRFWLAAMPMRDLSGSKRAILTIKISSAVVDDLTGENRDASIILLAITILVVILFLAATVRLWDYAVLYRKIKEVDQMKDEFISIASHELRTPLTITKGYISMILEGIYGKIDNPAVEKAIQTVANSNHRLEVLVEDLLNVSRIEQGRLQVMVKNIELEPIVQDVISDLKIKADEKKLALEYVKPANPLPLISADPERLKQVLVNLIGNSVNYRASKKQYDGNQNCRHGSGHVRRRPKAPF
jgi:signal transduction histidine kinase